ncbi:phenylalanine--tRNA ligase subunit beta [Flavisolibacter nicotianae]|uniref:phenylalanine--tRNA ligase subunit beta n=1 Tax=Flavisolibacter nicotianae TaxID=2364882 RepID=UPI000EAC1F34|nr:phenylalanine--tRNA ligase subunit beta [Flavisolibacter nicotianae]
MTISYNWLSEYLPVNIEPERLSGILTSIGLEVEKMESFEEVKGGLQGLLLGEVLDVQQHPNADKLKLTRVTVGGEPLQIVCGAPNVAAGQKVVVATVGTTIYPAAGEPLTMKVAKIRGVESYGMICAEDEIGLGTSHAGILVLPGDVEVGMKAADYFKPFSDVVYEIGLTPNRMDAMSHWGVARDVCAYLSHHDGLPAKPVIPDVAFKVDQPSLDITITVEDTEACKRYAGVCIANVKVGPSPRWMQERLKAIGLRPINNIVDITNYIQHETGQPLHAFDYDKIGGKKVVVKTLPDGSSFTTLDEKERKLSSEDLMICDEASPMCIAGVFGGLHSGVTENTTNIFLESAWFNPTFIRKTSFRHGLRTDAATRFEKGVDISNTANVLKRAAMLIRELAGASIASEVLDVYPSPEPKKEVVLPYQYLRKLSGKLYHPETVKSILESLQFTIVKEGIDAMVVQVPHHKPDVSIPADVVEEILRIDGLDNIEIPTSITITPSVEENYLGERLKEKTAGVLTGAGFTEILTNSITNAAYFTEEELKNSVKLLNNLSNELNMLRPSMLQTALEVIAFNLNRKNNNLRLFEFGKTYSTSGVGEYAEANHLCLYASGQLVESSWKGKSAAADVYYLKGVAEALFTALNIKGAAFEKGDNSDFDASIVVLVGKEKVGEIGLVKKSLASRFDIRQPVLFADLYWDELLQNTTSRVQFKGLSKFPQVERDLAMVVPKSLQYGEIPAQIKQLRIRQLQDIRLFDIFESEKLGHDKKSLAVNFTFLDEEKTLTDKEIDGWMNKIMNTLEKNIGAEIRKQ